MRREEITNSKTAGGKRYNLCVTYATREQALKTAKTLRKHREKAFVAPVSGADLPYAVYRRDEYSDTRGR